ncbi:Retrovirus-related Pol polyprotein from transposon RE1 [Senna tora]|uniref:Retrovirus-related Pol polyprotein from transposon RE1 n=1 Tax=Senna tora TaxID=362788 RepID=A0A834TNE9_9FABA|nr:Retrovirus-related Pol polyprotein from transposon RE1 [Senna tora]
MSSKTISPSLPQTEPELSIQSFHQCSSFISIKLSTNNLLLWRNQITPLVRSLGVLHHLTSGEKPTEEIKGDAEKSSPNPNYQKWVTNDGLLTSWLLGTMKEEVLTMINGDTAYEIWTSIEEQLLPATVEKARWLKNMFMTIKKGSRSLEEYLREFKSICDNLAAIKESVSDQDKVFQFAHGLGPRYESFRVAMLTKPPYPSFSQFLLALQGHEQIQNSQKEEERNFIEHAQAFFGQRGRGRGRNGRNNRNHFNSQGRGFTPAGRCDGQSQQSHNGNSSNPNNSKGEKQQQNTSANKSKVFCQICKKPNHEAIDCWYRYDYSYQSEDFPQELAALTFHDTKDDQSFIVDSGATSHMINDAGPCVDLIQPQEESTNPLIEQPIGDALTEHESSLPSEVVHQTSVESTSNAASSRPTRLCKPPSYLSDYVALATNSPQQCAEPKTLQNMKTAPHMEINQDMKIAPHMVINQGADMKAKVNHNVDLKTAEYKEMNSTNRGKYKGSTTNAI